MRTQIPHSTSSNEGLSQCPSSTNFRAINSVNESTCELLFNSSGKTKQHHGTYSQKSRMGAVLENLQLASDYIRSQSKAINDMIKQFHLFSGYLEQVNHKKRGGPQAWSVYLMYAQSISHNLNLTFHGNHLFQNHGERPLRIHVLENGMTTPLDLPLPALCSLISVNSFISGVLDHQLPTRKLVQQCITDLMDELLSLQSAKTNISQHIKSARTKSYSGCKKQTVKLVEDNYEYNALKCIFMQIKSFFQSQLA